jgi:hypothetical protein
MVTDDNQLRISRIKVKFRKHFLPGIFINIVTEKKNLALRMPEYCVKNPLEEG